MPVTPRVTNVAGGDSCARTRYRVSLRIDGELSQLEAALVDAHLKRCPACTEFATGAELTARKLRPEALSTGDAQTLPDQQESPAFAELSPELRD
jgi:predicted anti-sigma-YlaC factor YlaD